MIDISHTVVIGRPVEEVFAYAGDPTNDPAWAGVIIESERTSEGPLAVGSTLRQVFRFLGKRIVVDCEVSQYEPGRRVRLAAVARRPECELERSFEPVDGGTRVTLHSRGEAAGLFALAHPLIQRLGKRQMAADLENLKDLFEAGAVTG